jgi:ATP-dependent protease Clp ATPase subunit
MAHSLAFRKRIEGTVAAEPPKEKKKTESQSISEMMQAMYKDILFNATA